jgi:hypothetical protein
LIEKLSELHVEIHFPQVEWTLVLQFILQTMSNAIHIPLCPSGVVQVHEILETLQHSQLFKKSVQMFVQRDIISQKLID